MSNLKNLSFNRKNRIDLWRRVVSLMLALTVLACSGIFSAPVGAETVTELICGREEHAHSQDCYETVCDVSDADHEHSDECFGAEPVCGFEEHLHTEDCYTEVDETPNEDIFGDGSADELPDSVSDALKSDAVEVSDSQPDLATDGQINGQGDIATIADGNGYDDITPDGTLNANKSILLSDYGISVSDGCTIKLKVKGTSGNQVVRFYITDSSDNNRSSDIAEVSVNGGTFEAEVTLTVDFAANGGTGTSRLMVKGPVGGNLSNTTFEYLGIDVEEVGFKAFDMGLYVGNMGYDATTTVSGYGTYTLKYEGYKSGYDWIMVKGTEDNMTTLDDGIEIRFKSVKINGEELTFKDGDYWSYFVAGGGEVEAMLYFTYNGINVFNETPAKPAYSVEVEFEIVPKPPRMIRVNNITLGNLAYDGLDIDTATQMIGIKNRGNDSVNRYVVYVGRTLDLSAISKGTFSLAANDCLKYVDYDQEDVYVNLGKIVEFLALRPGTLEIEFKADNGDTEVFYIEVKYPIYVETEVAQLHKDRVHDFLEAAGVGTGSNERDYLVTDPDGNKLYIKNLDVGVNYRYWMFESDEVTLTAVSMDENSAFTCDTSIFEVVNTSTVQDANGFYVTTATFRVKEGVAGNNSAISFGGEAFYVQIKEHSHGDEGDSCVHHFDMEITAGGNYSKTATVSDDQFITITETTYKTIIEGVEECRIIGYPGKKMAHINNNGAGAYSGETVKTAEDGREIYTIPKSSYEAHTGEGDGENESTQFEFTSAYTGGFANRHVDAGFVDSVEFDLDIGYIPTGQTISKYDKDGNLVETVTWLGTVKTTTTYDSNGDVIDTKTETVNDIKEETSLEITDPLLTNMTKVMGSRDILDAYNRCPNHSGLDFTFSISMQELALKVNKELNGGTLKDKQFSFTLYQEASAEDADAEQIVNGEYGVVVNIQSNDVNGLVNFDVLSIMEAGTYTYYIKENIPANKDNSIIYDSSIYKVVVKVENSGGSLVISGRDHYRWNASTDEWASYSDQISFINNIPRKLPVTGGSGAGQYVYFGGVITLIGFLLLQGRKRVEGSI